MSQIDLFTAGRQARDEGIQKAIDHANAVVPDWSEKAYDVLKRFLSLHPGQFMAEEVRAYAVAIGFEEPPSKRSWGHVMIRARKEGLITKVGLGPVSNPKANMANAGVWQHNVPFQPNDDFKKESE